MEGEPMIVCNFIKFILNLICMILALAFRLVTYITDANRFTRPAGSIVETVQGCWKSFYSMLYNFIMSATSAILGLGAYRLVCGPGVSQCPSGLSD